MKYLTKFETTAAYNAAKDGLIKPNVSYIVEANGVAYKALRNDIITYYASAKLTENSSGLHTNAFSGASGQLTITSHEFDNGVGTIKFNDDVTTIGQYAFYGCSGMNSIELPDTVASIGQRAFASCGLTSIDIPDSVTIIGVDAFGLCTKLTSVNIPYGVTTINSGTFTQCTSLASVTIPNSVTSIAGFSQCRNLIRLNSEIDGVFNIPDSVTTIGDYTFQSCTSLTSIDIPSGVTSIGQRAFYGCSGLTSVTVEATTPPTLGGAVFSNNASGRKIYVPSESVDTYKAASRWSTYASDIEAIPSE